MELAAKPNRNQYFGLTEKSDQTDDLAKAHACEKVWAFFNSGDLNTRIS